MSAASRRVSALAKQLDNSLNPADDLAKAKENMSTDYKFAGWMGKDKNAIGNMVWEEFTPKTWSEDDVDIKITHSGICGSDCHTLRSGWGPTMYPCCVGHEIIGKAVKVGKNVKHVKVGDRVGVGAQSGSCQEADCPECSSQNENYCTRKNTTTYNSKWPSGEKSYGGYADYNRANGHFVIPIPEGLKSEDAAPMLCGGVTVFNPLTTYGAGPGKTVGIVGVGGLGHFGLLFAKALGADKVVAISRSASKKADAEKMGVDDFIATDEDKDWHKKHASSLDLIVCTVSSPKMPLQQYLSLLKVHGTFVQVGAPEEPLPAFAPFALLMKGAKIAGSGIGSPSKIKEMLDVAVKHNVKPFIETRSMKDVNQAVVDMDAGKARYRYVLINEHHL